MKRLICLLLIFSAVAVADEGPPLFVSLGSHCEVASYLDWHKARTAAYPFDWLFTFDYAKFLALMDNDFALFMDKAYLKQESRGNVFHEKYHIDFWHDWYETDFEDRYLEVAEKYERRLERFRELGKHPGKVYFIRAAFDLNLSPLYWNLTKECLTIDKSHAEALRNTLRKKFPGLDFALVVINYAEMDSPDLEDLERILEYKIRKSHKIEDYGHLIDQLPIFKRI